jgi:GT2 family glycosyltransferase
VKTVNKSCTIIIPTVGRPHDLEECLLALRRADNGLLREVLVVDDGAEQRVTVDDELVRELHVTVIRNDVRQGASASRNWAAELAGGDILGFIDDDARVLGDWFDVVAAEMTDGRAAITGRVLPFDSGLVSRARQWLYDERYRRLTPGSSVGFLAGGNSVVRRSAFLAAGGFPLQRTAADNALVARLESVGGDCCFVPGLRVIHRNGKGVVTAAQEAWRAGAANRLPPGEALARMVGTFRTLPVLGRPNVAVLNGALQVCNTLGQLTGIADGRMEPGGVGRE